jgi:hypothetical protein
MRQSVKTTLAAGAVALGCAVPAALAADTAADEAAILEIW